MNAQEIRQAIADHGPIAYGGARRLSLYRFDTAQPSGGEWPVSRWDWTEQEWRSVDPIPSRDVVPGHFLIRPRHVQELHEAAEGGRQRRRIASVAALLPERARPASWSPVEVTFYAFAYPVFLGVPDLAGRADGADVRLTRDSFLDLAATVHDVVPPAQDPVLCPVGFPEDLWQRSDDELAEEEAEHGRRAALERDTNRLARLIASVRIAASSGTTVVRAMPTDSQVEAERHLATEERVLEYREILALPVTSRRAGELALVERITGLHAAA